MIKKLTLIAIGLMLCVCSCTCTIDKKDYECTITYTLDGVAHTETVLFKGVPTTHNRVPGYVVAGDEIKIIMVPAWEEAIIYKGTLPTTVKHFEYRTLKSYTENFSGVVIKVHEP